MFHEYLSFLSFSVKQKHGLPLDNSQGTSTHLTIGVCIAYCEFPDVTAFQMKRSADVPTSHHSHTSSVPLISSSSATLHMLICTWTTVKPSGPVWLLCQVTETDRAKLGCGQLNQMLLHSTLVQQLPIIEHKIERHEKGTGGNGNVYYDDESA